MIILQTVILTISALTLQLYFLQTIRKDMDYFEKTTNVLIQQMEKKE